MRATQFAVSAQHLLITCSFIGTAETGPGRSARLELRALQFTQEGRVFTHENNCQSAVISRPALLQPSGTARGNGFLKYNPISQFPLTSAMRDALQAEYAWTMHAQHTCGLKWTMLSTIWQAAASSRITPGSCPRVAKALHSTAQVSQGSFLQNTAGTLQHSFTASKPNSSDLTAVFQINREEQLLFS